MPGGGARVVFLIILKWIGIILLCILAVILLVGLCILFVPVRYHISVKCLDRWRAKGRVSWMFPLFQLLFDTERPERNGLRIAGISVSRRRRKHRKKHKRSPKKSSKSVKKTSAKRTDVRDVSGKAPAKQVDKNLSADRSESKNSFLEKCRQLWNRIKNFFLSIRSIFAKIKAVDRESIELIRLLAVNAGRLLKHVFPRRIRGWIHFGTSDPALTGELLGGLSILFAMYGQGVRVTPDFEQEVLEGELEVKGYLRGIVLLILIIKVHPLQQIKHFDGSGHPDG